GQTLVAPLRPAIVDGDGAALDPTEFAQSLDKGGDAQALERTRVGTQISDGRHLPRLLRARRERPRRRSAAEECDELAALHSITSSAVARTGAGTVSPSMRAVSALMTSSNFDACTTGKSAGFAPLRMRPT